MRTIYVDSDSRCHIANNGTMKAVETSFFDGKCNTFIEGHCYKNSENGAAIYPWKPYETLVAAQRQYEADLADLQAAYQEGVNSV